MSRLFLVALLAVLGVVSGFAPVTNTASVAGELSHSCRLERKRERNAAAQKLMVEMVRPSFIEMEMEKR